MITLDKSKKIFWLAAAFIVVTSAVLIISILATPSDDTRQEFISKIPHYTTQYTIVYSKEKDQIYVNILKEPYEENRKNADDWVKSNGQNPQDLKIIYYPSNVFRN
jgi:hypothetical protein